MSVPALRGSQVTLRPMTYEDVPHLARWGSDAAFRYHQWGQKPGRFEEKNARAWIERMSRPGDSACWVIEHNGRPIGFANYRDFHPKGKSAEIGIGIGEPDLWGKHLGREALETLLRYLFDDLGLHRLGLSVVAFNDRAISMYKAIGFEVEGIERDGVGTEDGFVDDVKMAIVKGRPRPDFDPRPVTLEGRHVRLVPLRMEHAQALFEAADEDDIWVWMQPRPNSLGGYERYIRWALDQQIIGTQLPFAVIRKSDETLVGTTRYAHIDPPNHTLEIGYTLYGKGARRSPVNTECKLLLLRHAFEALGANRVWLQTDKRNERSQSAIARLGATREGELRNERIMPDGRLRTSVIFGITKDEWPTVRERLLGYLAR
ncbi:MAG: GNAT family N-acetyltransferase [Chloroflexota bacterium]|nr:GNAT family N-acetyltransferase [Chloroflexota bacterium]